MLNVQSVHTSYGNIEALHGVDIEVKAGEIATIIGANGAGKTTMLMTVCGTPQANKGQILFKGKDITRLKTNEIISRGICVSPEGRRIFPHMSVLENLQMGAVVAEPEYYEEDLAFVYELFPIIKNRLEQQGGTLSGGEQQMLAIARALMGRPELLLLDEPSLGLAPMIVKQIFEIIKEINERGVSILLVEQNAYHALKLAHQGYVMVNGKISIKGSGQELLDNPEIRAAYLEGG